MKAIRRDDGKEIEVRLYTEKQYVATEAEDGEVGKRIYLEDALIIKETVDWEAFRREAAKDFVVALVSSGNGLNPQNIAYSIEMADELVRQLKDGK